ncbi:MAG: hypothetical protein A2Y66_06650 [Nitrospirae bacterium RBG_13_41_22]|nr:MAG: hypothetical protein A2Y66_06650 [Nitrospirae bacterium RBG_13_41_22]
MLSWIRASRSSRFFVNFTAAIILALVTYFLYHDALNAYWRFDDGAHLSIVTEYKPWQYFFVPEITHIQSGANVTPWNAFTYSVNLWLFGLDPKGFYAHQIVSLWIASLVTFLLLRLWVEPAWAIFGAVLFLAGAPTVHIANELMTGHYLEGLVFAGISLIFFILAVRKQNYLLAIVGAFIYLLTVTTKEIYVPLAGLLLFLPESTFRNRLKFSIPYLIVGIAYIPWRYAVQGKLIGGYDQSFSGGIHPWTLVTEFLKIPFLLFGHNLLSIIAVVLLFIVFVVSLFRLRTGKTLFMVGILLILIPLFPLAHWPGISSGRYLFLPWWSISCGIALILPRLNWGHISTYVRIGLCVLFLLSALLNAKKEHAAFVQEEKITAESYRFLLNSNSSQVFIRPTLLEDLKYFHYILNGIIKAEKKFNPSGPDRAMIISDEAELLTIDLKGITVWRFSENYENIENITTKVPLILNRLKDLSMSSMHRSLQVHRSCEADFKTRAERLAGYVDNISYQGRRLRIAGWVDLPLTEPDQVIHIFVLPAPLSKSIDTVARPDVVNHFHDRRLWFTGFRITLDFRNIEESRQAASDVCVAAESAARPLMLLNSKNPHCECLIGSTRKQP